MKLNKKYIYVSIDMDVCTTYWCVCVAIYNACRAYVYTHVCMYRMYLSTMCVKNVEL